MHGGGMIMLPRFVGVVLFLLAATAFVQPSLANVESLPSQDIITDLSVDCTSRNMDINNAIGQTFFPQSFGILHKIAIWIKPDIYDITSYELQVYTGVFDTLLETSTEISINELEPASWEIHTAGLAQYYDFTFASSEVLIQGEMYSWKLVRTSEYSGTFARCGNIIEGQGYLLGTSPESGGNDYAFKLMVHPVSMPIGVPSSSPSSASPSEMMNFTGTGTISSSPTGDDTTNPNAKNVTSGAATVWYSSYAHFTTMLAGLAVSIILSGATFAA